MGKATPSQSASCVFKQLGFSLVFNDSQGRTFMEKMVGQKDSAPANRMLQHALQDKTQLLGPHLRYSEKLWNPNGVYCGDTAPGAVDRTDPYLYIRAARKHQSFVLNELLPDVGLVVR